MYQTHSSLEMVAPQLPQQMVLFERAQQSLARERALASLMAALLFGMWLTFAFAYVASAHSLASARPSAQDASLLGSILLPLVVGALVGSLVVWLKRPRGARRP